MGIPTEVAMACGRCFKGQKVRSMLLGQTISVLITGTGACSSLLAAKYVDIPVTQSSLNYLFLSFHLLWTLRNAGGEGLGAPVWHYVLWALCDVEANFLV